MFEQAFKAHIFGPYSPCKALKREKLLVLTLAKSKKISKRKIFIA